jgi:hypothetical protein
MNLERHSLLFLKKNHPLPLFSNEGSPTLKVNEKPPLLKEVPNLPVR